ncbi:protein MICRORCHIDIA 6-like [Henckelia pumila]|uniref:protein MICRORCHIDIA 6-like n=1 Tax=Henckelia pumila TaxID=405737 RepID=UPI003C6E2DA0
MSTTGVNLSSIHGLREVDQKAVKLEQNLVIISLQSQENSRFDALNTEHNGSHIWDNGLSSIDDSTLCSTSSITPAPISRQFWNAGNYDETLNSMSTTPPTCGGYLHIHPKFLHSNATSHKWVFGAIAELIDNVVDEVHNGATFVVIDKTSNPRDGKPALLIQDDGGGMSPEAMRRCMSFGFSDKKSKITIGQYGNGFKTSSMRLGADVVVFTRRKDRNSTQSVGLLSYTFLMQTRHDRIVVPMVDYQFDSQNGTWNSLHNERHHQNNLSILLQWSPFSTEAELLKQCDDVGLHGTRIIIYNLWHDDQGKIELDFESDPEDICIAAKETNTKMHHRMALSEQHLANRLRCSLRAYLSILYLRIPQNFFILLRRRVVIYHSIANDLKFPEFILYKPQNVEGQVVTTVGFLKEAPNVNIHGFNVYHKNRLILPFWHVVSYACSRGRGVVGVLEANFIEPTHNKQEFERTPVFQKLETRLKEMTQEYWDYHCGYIGYQPKKQPRPAIAQFSSDSTQDRGMYQPILSGKDSFVAAGHEVNASLNHMAPNHGVFLKRKGDDRAVESEREKKMAVKGPRTASVVHGQRVQHSVAPTNILEPQEAVNIIQENQKRLAQCEEYEKSEEELNVKVTRLRAEIQEAKREYGRLLLESKFLERVKRENNRLT